MSEVYSDITRYAISIINSAIVRLTTSECFEIIVCLSLLFIKSLMRLE